MRLAELPRLPLATLPTPLEEAPRLAAAIGGPRLWLKRDDLTGFALGGNKVRKLEFLLADAVAQGADALVTGAGPQSNHLRTAAAAARKAGLAAVLVMHGRPPAAVQGNHLLDELLGAEVVFTGSADRTSVDRALVDIAAERRARGGRPYVIPRGGASPLGCVGYVAAMLELETQRLALGLRVDHLVCAVGSCGTLAGIWLGATWLRAPYAIWGLSVSRPRAECAARVRDLAGEAARLLGLPPPDPAAAPEIRDDYLGPGYGLPTAEGGAAIRLAARTEGVFLDPVYTGKAMAGLIDLARRGTFGRDETVLFLHTGGAPALFAYADALVGRPAG